MGASTGHRIFTTTLASVYPLYLAKVERKGRTQDELAKGRAMEKVLRN